jgi:hypothetical protein
MYRVAQVVHHVPARYIHLLGILRRYTYRVAQVVPHNHAKYIFYGVLRRYEPGGPVSTPCSCAVHLL